MDDMFEDPEEDEQADEELNKVMDSIGLEVSSSVNYFNKFLSITYLCFYNSF